jgi:hypothetical protein
MLIICYLGFMNLIDFFGIGISVDTLLSKFRLLTDRSMFIIVRYSRRYLLISIHCSNTCEVQSSLLCRPSLRGRSYCVQFVQIISEPVRGHLPLMQTKITPHWVWEDSLPTGHYTELVRTLIDKENILLLMIIWNGWRTIHLQSILR